MTTETPTPQLSHEAEQRGLDSLRIMFGMGGLLAVIVGVLVLINPVKTGAAMMQILAVIVSIYMIGTGAVYLGTAIFSKAITGWARTGNIVLGLIYIIAGVILMANVQGTAVFLTLFLAIMLGIVWIVEAFVVFSVVKSSGHRVLTVLYGILCLVAGLVLLFSPLLSAIALWIYLAVSLIVLGATQVLRAFRISAA